MSAVRLSERQGAALLALLDIGTPASGEMLADVMTAHWRECSTAAAHQAASGLVNKKLAVKGYPAGAVRIRYELTGAGREAAVTLRGAS